jgi:hypothetical protein
MVEAPHMRFDISEILKLEIGLFLMKHVLWRPDWVMEFGMVISKKLIFSFVSRKTTI